MMKKWMKRCLMERNIFWVLLRQCPHVIQHLFCNEKLLQWKILALVLIKNTATISVGGEKNIEFSEALDILGVIIKRTVLSLGSYPQVRHQNMKIKNCRFLAKTRNKSAMKNFPNICNSESMLNCRFRHTCIKLTHTIWLVWEARP